MKKRTRRTRKPGPRELQDSTHLRVGDIIYLAYRLWDDPRSWPPPPRLVEVIDVDGGGRTRSHGKKVAGFRFRVLGVDTGGTIVDAEQANVMLTQSMSHENFAKHCTEASLWMGHEDIPTTTRRKRTKKR